MTKRQKNFKISGASATFQVSERLSDADKEDFLTTLTADVLAPRDLHFEMTIPGQIIYDLADYSAKWFNRKYDIDITGKDIIKHQELYAGLEEVLYSFIEQNLSDITDVDAHGCLDRETIANYFKEEIEQRKAEKEQERLRQRIEKASRQKQDEETKKAREIELWKRYVLKYGIPTQAELEQFKNEKEQK